MVKAVLFDMDGVIFNSERLYSKAVPDIAQKLGYTMDMPFFIRTLGISNQECHRLYIETYGPDFPYGKASEMLRSFILTYNKQHTLPLKDGVPECLQALKARNLQIVLATSSPRYVVDAIFNSLPQLNRLFDGKVCGDEVTQGKPAPEIYQKAAALAGYPPAECLGVEDAPSGLKAIRACGAQPVMVPDLLAYTDALKPYVDHVLSSLRALPALADRLNAR
ncbi:MAG TPA: HAD family phosphatase [Candidatus Limiplasma sp.]|nr:HAD family phosphatase [Candidatus Limiplasma sp.]